MALVGTRAHLDELGDHRLAEDPQLMPWISPRTIKETLAPAQAFEYPFMSEK